MNHEDKLRAAFRRADAALPERGLDLEATMKMAHRSRRIYVAAASAAAVLLVVGGVWAAGSIGDSGTSPVPPAGSPDQTPSLSPSPSPSPTPPSSGPPATCSASGMEVPTEDESGALSSGSPDRSRELPDPVAETREELIDLAATCDFEGLASVAERSELFTYSFGGEGDPAEHWRTVDETEEVMATLIEILQMSHVVQRDTGGDEPIYTWPAVFLDDPTDAEWDEVRTLYSDEEIEQMKRFGGYIGYRTGITETGDWLFYVAGD